MTEQVKIKMMKSDVVALAEVLRPPDRSSGPLDWARDKFAYYLGLVEKALEKEYFAINKMRVPSDGYGKYVQKFQELRDRYSKRNERGVAIPGGLENPEKYYEKREALDGLYEKEIKEEDARRKSVSEELQTEVEITISHKLIVKNYLKELHKIRRSEMNLLMPFFEGSVEDLDFSAVEKEDGEIAGLVEKVSRLEKTNTSLEKDNNDLQTELKAEKGKKKE